MSLSAGAKDWVRARARTALCRMHGVFRGVGISPRGMPPVAYVVENADWAIRWVGAYVRDGILAAHPGTIALTTNPAPLAGRVVHFGSQYMWLAWGGAMARSNRYVVSIWHGKPEDGPVVATHVEALLDSVPRLSRVVTGASMMERRLLEWGVPSEKLVRIPLGCDTRLFIPPSKTEREAARAALGVPAGAICIGSFQKDGVGWDTGMEPKLIKGPDVFIEAARRFAKEMPIFVLLTGPARGYVKQGLERYGIPYRHDFLDSYLDIIKYYHALDLYLVTSREEGGPLALMESMATHVAVVSTRVGQAEDLIIDGMTGGLVEVDDVEGLVDRALALMNADETGRAECLKRARDIVVRHFDWRDIARAHYDRVYAPLL